MVWRLLRIPDNVTIAVAWRVISGTVMWGCVSMIPVSTWLVIEDQAQHPVADEGRAQPHTGRDPLQMRSVTRGESPSAWE
ncbi:MAG: hypothetical protein ACRERE_30330 [Candidatus Entotheonellia bacterium]